jgi:hypothetical protein
MPHWTQRPQAYVPTWSRRQGITNPMLIVFRTISTWKGKNAIGFARLRRDYGEAGIAIDRFDGTIVNQQLEVVVK